MFLDSRCVKKHLLNNSPTSVYSKGASTVANTLEAKEPSNGQVTAETYAALGNLNHGEHPENTNTEIPEASFA
uniref:Uncharacterized protein n=1 Tax=Tanacetum cinerariifolium TaxID=118510 RepID=A0A6L2KGG9_TANCI|nr:hypothetical protein [Tanacetum cinerariifolium]